MAKQSKKDSSTAKSGSTKKTTTKKADTLEQKKNKIERRIKRKRQKLIRDIVVILILIVIGFVADMRYYWFSDIIENSVTNRDPMKTITLTDVAKKNDDSEMLIHFVDVGQGDSIVLQLPYGKNMIIDGGPRNSKNEILSFIESANITTFDYLLLTHTDEDHVGSLDDVISETVVKSIYRPNVSSSQITTAVYRDFLTAVEAEGATDNFSEAGLIIEDEGFRILFFTPLPRYYQEVKKGSKYINDISPIIILEYSDKKILFTGDAEKNGETMFIDVINGKEELSNPLAAKDIYGYNADVDLFKVGHHGSSSSSTPEFLNIIKPEYAVISVGAGNKYNHPHTEAEHRLSSYNIHTERTDLKGDITVRFYLDEVNGGAEMDFIFYDNTSNEGTNTDITMLKNMSESVWICIKRNYTIIYAK